MAGNRSCETFLLFAINQVNLVKKKFCVCVPDSESEQALQICTNADGSHSSGQRQQQGCREKEWKLSECVVTSRYPVHFLTSSFFLSLLLVHISCHVRCNAGLWWDSPCEPLSRHFKKQNLDGSLLKKSFYNSTHQKAYLPDFLVARCSAGSR